MTLKIALVALVVSGASPAFAQTWAPPRTPDGHPDLQGIWTNATITPLERAKDLGAKEFFTEAEAAENRKRALVPTPTAERSGTEAHYEFTQFGLDRTQYQVAFSLRTSLIVGPEGRVPPLTPEAQQRIAERAANAKGHEFDGPESRGIHRDERPSPPEAALGGGLHDARAEGHIRVVTGGGPQRVPQRARGDRRREGPGQRPHAAHVA